MAMAQYLVRRLFNTFVLVLGTVLLTFLLTHVVAPNPAIVWTGQRASPAEIQNVVREYHLDQPIYIQLLFYLRDTFTLNFGISPWFNLPVSTLIQTYYPRTLVLDLMAIALTIVLGVATGAFAAAHQDRSGDHLVRAIYLVTWGAPPFLVALILQFFLSYHSNIFPPNQFANPALAFPHSVTGIVPLDSLITGDYQFFYSWAEHAILPVVALSMITFGLATRIVRSSMLGVLRTDFIRTARMKGIGDRRATYVHALKNSSIPVITVVALIFSYSIAGSIVVEQIFAYQGMGYLIFQSIFQFDYPTLIGCTIVITVSVALINFVADVLYALVDPRVRLGGR